MPTIKLVGDRTVEITVTSGRKGLCVFMSTAQPDGLRVAVDVEWQDGSTEADREECSKIVNALLKMAGLRCEGTTEMIEEDDRVRRAAIQSFLGGAGEIQ